MRYNMKESGKRIQELRRDRGMTQTQLAEYVGISSDNLGRIERGQQGVSIDLLINDTVRNRYAGEARAKFVNPLCCVG